MINKVIAYRVIPMIFNISLDESQKTMMHWLRFKLKPLDIPTVALMRLFMWSI